MQQGKQIIYIAEITVITQRSGLVRKQEYSLWGYAFFNRNVHCDYKALA